MLSWSVDIFATKVPAEKKNKQNQAIYIERYLVYSRHLAPVNILRNTEQGMHNEFKLLRLCYVGWVDVRNIPAKYSALSLQ